MVGTSYFHFIITPIIRSLYFIWMKEGSGETLVEFVSFTDACNVFYLVSNNVIP